MGAYDKMVTDFGQKHNRFYCYAKNKANGAHNELNTKIINTTRAAPNSK